MSKAIEQTRSSETLPAECEGGKEFLLSLADRLRATTDPAEVKAIAAEMLSEHLHAKRVGYGEMDEKGEVIRRRSPSGEARVLRAFGSALADELRAGRTVLVHDSHNDARTQDPEAAKAWADLKMQALIAVPLVRNGLLVAMLFVIERQPRAWSAAEVQLVEHVAERTWEAVERARAEAELRESQERLRKVTDAMPALISYMDASLHFRFVNQLYSEWLGRPREEILGRHVRDVLGRQTYRTREPYLSRALAGERVTYEAEFPGTPLRKTVVQYVPHIKEDGRVVGIYALIQDVTEQKRAEDELRRSRDELATVLDTVPAAIFISTDPSCDVIRVNARGAEWFRMDPGANASQNNPTDQSRHFHIVDSEGRDLPVEELPIQRAARGKPFTRRDLRVRFDDGTFLDLHGNAAPLLDDKGKIRGAVAAFLDIGERRRAEDALREESRTLETLNRIGAALTAELDLERLVQMITDAGVDVIGARLGAFLYHVQGEAGDSAMPSAVSGAAREEFERLELMRGADLLHSTFGAGRIIRCDDLHSEPRFERNPPDGAVAKQHMPVRSFLAVPVVSRSGETIGSLLFGHPRPARFSERHERLMAGIAAQAAIAIDNARLFQEAQREIEQRKKAEDYQRLLIAELNHRVKNTLAIVQGVAQQTFRPNADMGEARRAFEGRLAALSSAHNVLTSRNWEHAHFTEIVEGALAGFHRPGDGRAAVSGEDMRIEPKTAVSLAMAFHELATNAVKYGAWSNHTGRVTVEWRVVKAAQGPRMHLVWREEGGPPVTAPRKKGFGSLMVGRALAGELGGSVKLVFDRAGLRCEIDAPLPPKPRPTSAGTNGSTI